MVRRAFRKLVENQSSLDESSSITIRRYTVPNLDELTGDPKFVVQGVGAPEGVEITWDMLTRDWNEYTGTWDDVDYESLLVRESQVYLECKVPVLMSDSDDYRAKFDPQYTGELNKRIRIYVPDGPIYPMTTDVIFANYNGSFDPYKVISLRKMNGKYQLDLERIDRG